MLLKKLHIELRLMEKSYLHSHSPFLKFSQGHSAEIITLSFNTTGDRIITGSFDNTVAVWEVVTGRY